MSKRVSPTERLRAEIDEVFAGGEDLSRAIERVAQLGAQLLLQSAVEAEVAAFLGRDRYERAASCGDPHPGMRNGYCPTTVKTTAGPVTLARPKLRGTTERFASQLFGTHVTKTNALESLVIAGFVRGLSTRDVEAALVEALGEQAAVSKSTVSRICGEIKTQFEAWSARRLDDVELDYLFLDGSHFKYHANASAEPVLAGWGIDTGGKPVFVGLAAASSESGDAWEGFLTGLGERGLACPLLVISDGAAGLIGAVERTMGAALRQRCLIHRARNVLAKVPKNAQAEVKARLLGDLRPARGCPARPGRGGQGSSQDRLVRHTLARLVSGGGALPARRPRLADRLPAVSARALDPRAPLQLHRTHLRRDAPPGQGDRPAARRALLPVAGVGGTRPRLGRVARVRHDLRRTPITAGPAPQHARPANPTAATEFGTTHRNRPGTNRFHSHRVASQMQASGTDIRHFYIAPGTPPPSRTAAVDPMTCGSGCSQYRSTRRWSSPWCREGSPARPGLLVRKSPHPQQRSRLPRRRL